MRNWLLKVSWPWCVNHSGLNKRWQDTATCVVFIYIRMHHLSKEDVLDTQAVLTGSKNVNNYTHVRLLHPKVLLQCFLKKFSIQVTFLCLILCTQRVNNSLSYYYTHWTISACCRQYEKLLKYQYIELRASPREPQLWWRINAVLQKYEKLVTKHEWKYDVSLSHCKLSCLQYIDNSASQMQQSTKIHENIWWHSLFREHFISSSTVSGGIWTHVTHDGAELPPIYTDVILLK